MKEYSFFNFVVGTSSALHGSSKNDLETAAPNLNGKSRNSQLHVRIPTNTSHAHVNTSHVAHHDKLIVAHDVNSECAKNETLTGGKKADGNTSATVDSY